MLCDSNKRTHGQAVGFPWWRDDFVISIAKSLAIPRKFRARD
jgi:hypothetical protein